MTPNDTNGDNSRISRLSNRGSLSKRQLFGQGVRKVNTNQKRESHKIYTLSVNLKWPTACYTSAESALLIQCDPFSNRLVQWSKQCSNTSKRVSKML